MSQLFVTLWESLPYESQLNKLQLIKTGRSAKPSYNGKLSGKTNWVSSENSHHLVYVTISSQQLTNDLLKKFKLGRLNGIRKVSISY